jgi:hypothetical protein
MDATEFLPDPRGRPKHYLNPELGLCVLRPGQSLEQFIGELAAAPAKAAAHEADLAARQADREALLDALIAETAARLAGRDDVDAGLKAAATREATRTIGQRAITRS